jgi:transcriptional regulator with XRE-family HTH domain
MKRRGAESPLALKPEVERQCKLLGSALRVLRHQKKRKQIVLSLDTGITMGMLSGYETGHQLPSLKSLMALLMGLECDFHDLQDSLDYVAGKPVRSKPQEEEVSQAQAEQEVGGALITLIKHLALQLPHRPETIEPAPARARRSGRAG